MNGSDIGFERLEFSPSMPAGVTGITLAASRMPMDVDSFARLTLSIAYQIDEEGFSGLGVETPMEAAVLICVNGSTVYAKNIIGNVVPFFDDYYRKKGLVAGFLNFKLASHVSMNISRDLYVTVSIGGLLSNTLIFPKQPKPN